MLSKDVIQTALVLMGRAPLTGDESKKAAVAIIALEAALNEPELLSVEDDNGDDA